MARRFVTPWGLAPGAATPTGSVADLGMLPSPAKVLRFSGNVLVFVICGGSDDFFSAGSLEASLFTSGFASALGLNVDRLVVVEGGAAEVVFLRNGDCTGFEVSRVVVAVPPEPVVAITVVGFFAKTDGAEESGEGDTDEALLLAAFVSG